MCSVAGGAGACEGAAEVAGGRTGDRARYGQGRDRDRDLSRGSAEDGSWGRGNSGKPIGVAEITKKRQHGPGAVGVGHAGSAKDADSQIYITLRAAPSLDGKYTVFGKVIKGLDVAQKIQKTDVLKKASVKE
jgi:cyclophilin family peptidyl-prolyl cis-trans isomerase